MKRDYSSIINYFTKRRFGSQMPVLTALSFLPVKDRVEILRELINIDRFNIEIYNKLSMALLKSGKYDEGINLLKEGYDYGVIEEDNFELMLGKLNFLKETNGNNFGSSADYNQTIALIEQDKKSEWYEKYKEFYDIILKFCNENK